MKTCKRTGGYLENIRDKPITCLGVLILAITGIDHDEICLRLEASEYTGQDALPVDFFKRLIPAHAGGAAARYDDGGNSHVCE
jgi:hypothetical protein